MTGTIALAPLLRPWPRHRLDVVCLQEVQQNPALGRDQLAELQAASGYPHAAFFRARTKATSKCVLLPYPLEHGLGILSEYPIEDVVVIPLAKANADDREDRITVYFSITKDRVKHHFADIHFSNSDVWAADHLRQVFQTIESLEQAPILMGDFNIFSLTLEGTPRGADYACSFDFKKYMSYPEDGDTLDYILLLGGYSFDSVDCREEYLSDHRMLVAKIQPL